MKKCFSLWSAIALIVTVSACTKSSPARPSTVADSDAATSSVTDAKTGVTLTSPALVSPASNASLRFAEQPLTLTVRNGVSTGSTARTYTFQVATDAAFGAIVATKDNVAEGNGQTAVVLDKLAGNKTYYWRVRVNSGSVAGLFTAPRVMNIGPEVVLQAPVLVSPANGGNLSSQAPLIVNNVVRSGPAGALTYRFEVSDSNSFGNLVFTATVNEQSNQTQTIMNARLTTNGTYFWRARASDNSNGVTGPFSSAFTFKYVPFDLSQATIVNSPSDLAQWEETAKITSINITGDSFQVDFDRRDGPNRWPDVLPAGWSGPLQYTLGMCVNMNDHWFCSGVVQFWHGRTLTDSGNPGYINGDWFFDARWGPMMGYQPRDGELVGIFVGSGNLRDAHNVTRASCPAFCERSNVALIPWSTGGGVSYVFNAAKTLLKP